MGKSSRGFTLIELLVTISIIAVLAAAGLTTYAVAQKSARITKRLEDLQALRAALESYKLANSYYPKVTTSVCIGATTGLADTSLSPTFVPAYMPILPNDPSNSSNTTTPCYIYTADTNGTEYKVRTSNTEMTSAEYKGQPNYIDPDRDGTADDCTIQTGGTITAWAVYSSVGTAATNACAF